MHVLFLTHCSSLRFVSSCAGPHVRCRGSVVPREHGAGAASLVVLPGGRSHRQSSSEMVKPHSRRGCPAARCFCSCEIKDSLKPWVKILILIKQEIYIKGAGLPLRVYHWCFKKIQDMEHTWPQSLPICAPHPAHLCAQDHLAGTGLTVGALMPPSPIPSSSPGSEDPRGRREAVWDCGWLNWFTRKAEIFCLRKWHSLKKSNRVRMLQVQTKASGKNLKKVLALNSKNGHISKTIHTLHCTLPSNWQVLISVTRSLPCPRTRLLFARACGIVDGHQGAACTKLRATDLRCLRGAQPSLGRHVAPTQEHGFPAAWAGDQGIRGANTATGVPAGEKSNAQACSAWDCYTAVCLSLFLIFFLQVPY